MGAGDVEVTVETVFEQFPASVRGAVVVRGRDRDPHHVVLEEADVVEVPQPNRSVLALELGRVVVDVAPRREVMIPFEVPFAELRPGWYQVTAEVMVDGQQRVRGPTGEPRRFVVAWPGGTVRRGTIDTGLTIKAPGSRGAKIDRVVCRPDAAVVHWRHAPSETEDFREFGDLKVVAGRDRLPRIEEAYDPATGARTTTTYPVLREHTKLVFELDRRYREGKPVQRGRWSASLSLD